DGFLTEVQEAGFRYFYNFAHPTSHLPREGIKAKDSWTMDTISGVSTGMYFFNMAMGVERGFVTRKDAVQHIAVALKFLTRDTDRFHGAFPHWIHGESGKVIPFSSTDNGADMVETAILAKGLLFAREYFDETNQQEAFIRRTADNLWRTIEWNKFIHNDAMAWHWSPNYGFGNLPIVGFNEAEIAYILGVGSPTYSISPETYWNGWVGKNANYFNPRMVAGENGTIHLQLGHDYGLPMFLMHYSYMGLDPRQVPMPDGNLFEEFERLTLANHDYCTLNAGRFAGYDKFWGLTASLDPDGYKAHEPMHVDNGTISPTGALASMPYQPELVMEMMETMYLQYGEMLWGPFGFYDAFNFSRNWVAYGYIGIDVGPIGPMIENYRTGILWQTFMKAPEVNTAIKEIWTHPNASILAE
ncbi:MAG TPA: beta-glucosidase, partial [Opitutae bacterium]|nr:beta-glucosidase [Opitutae bacterium]